MEILGGYSTSPELEIQQRSVEFMSLYAQQVDIRIGVLEQMPAPEIKATVMGTGMFWIYVSFRILLIALPI